MNKENILNYLKKWLETDVIDNENKNYVEILLKYDYFGRDKDINVNIDQYFINQEETTENIINVFESELVTFDDEWVLWYVELLINIYNEYKNNKKAFEVWLKMNWREQEDETENFFTWIEKNENFIIKKYILEKDLKKLFNSIQLL